MNTSGTRARPRTERTNKSAKLIALCGIGAAALAVVAALLGVVPPVLDLWGDRQPENSPCPGPPAVELNTPERNDQVGPSFELMIEVRCTPQPEHRYVLIAQPPDDQVDPDNPHPEYYLTWRMERPQPNLYRRHIDLSGHDIGAAATYYVISVDPAAYDKLIAQLQPTNFVLSLPDHVVISNRIRVVRSW
jgi:hypothetical protein